MASAREHLVSALHGLQALSTMSSKDLEILHKQLNQLDDDVWDLLETPAGEDARLAAVQRSGTGEPGSIEEV